MQKLLRVKITVLLVISFLTFTTNAQTRSQAGVSEEQLFQQMGKFDSGIDKLQNLSKMVAQTIDPERVEIQASYSQDPQRTIDFILIRYERNDSQIQLTLAEKAQEAAQYLITHRYDKHGIADIVLKQGIDKYNDMCDFYVQRAKKLRSSFTTHWKTYCSKYGNADQSIFVQDDQELATYGVNNIGW